MLSLDSTKKIGRMRSCTVAQICAHLWRVRNAQRAGKSRRDATSFTMARKLWMRECGPLHSQMHPVCIVSTSLDISTFIPGHVSLRNKRHVSSYRAMPSTFHCIQLIGICPWMRCDGTCNFGVAVTIGTLVIRRACCHWPRICPCA